MAGLDDIELVVRDAAKIADIATRAERAEIAIATENGGTTLHDPWGTAIRLKVEEHQP